MTPDRLRALALLLRQGDSVPQALERLGRRDPAWAAAAAAARRGADLPEALGPLLEVGMTLSLRGPEQELPEALEELAMLDQESRRRRRGWLAVLVYPALVGLLVLATVFLGGIFLGPFVQLFEGMNLNLPLPTRILLLLAQPAWALVLGLPVVVLLLALFGPSRGRLMLPVIGTELRHREAQGFLAWMAYLVRREVPVPDALRTAAHCCSAPVMAAQMRATAEEIARGTEPALAVERLTWLPELARWLLQGCFSVEQPAQAMGQAARILARDSELKATDGVAMLETLAMIGVCLAAAFVVFSIFLPLYQLVGNL